ncbi:hypothetical protein BDC45DRAFT_556343 [Circinella umbellata]|nr:hypothetical protein BDC45DRAFT_556343 [Circinella umbellata]
MSAAVEQEPRLFDKLSFDILINIFSYFTKTECLQCMGVCKAWYNNIPGYTENVWTEMKICRYNTGVLKRSLWLHFIGKHVKRISFQEFRKQKDLFKILQKLVDYGCDNFQYLEFSYCATSNQEIFLPLLSKLTKNVSQINIKNHDTNIAFLWLMKTCPKLTRLNFIDANYFAYTLHGLYDREPPVLGEYDHDNQNGPRLILPQQQPPFYNLIDVNFKGTLLAVSRLLPILQKCPSLEYLSFTRKTNYSIPGKDDYISNIVDFSTCFSSCPNLKYLDINNDFVRLVGGSRKLKEHYIDKFKKEMVEISAATKVEVVTTTAKESNDRQETSHLQYLKVFDTNTLGAQDIKHVLLENRHSLKHLIVANDLHSIPTIDNHTTIPYNIDWTFVFPVFSAPNLRSLILDSILYSQVGPLLAMIQRCPSLEVVALFNNNHAYSISLNLSRLLLPLKHLKCLELANFTLDFDSSGDAHDNNDNTNPAPLFEQLITRGSKLETIILSDSILNITDTFLIAAAYIPTLKHIQLTLDPENYNDRSICLFSKLLHKSKSIQSIKLRGMRALSREFLCSLGDLPFLNEISFDTDNGRSDETVPSDAGMPVDKPGLFQMLHKSTSLKNILIASEEMLRDEQSDLHSALIEEKLLHVKYEMMSYSSIFTLLNCSLTAI